MKTSKLFITSLLAAAATLSVPAYADLLGNVTYTGGSDISQGTTLGAYTTSESITTGTTTTSTNFVSSVPVGGDFWPGAYTMMFWIDFGSNTISSDSVIFEYGGTATTDALGANALVISSSGELIFGRGKYINNTSYTFENNNNVLLKTSSLGLTSGVHHIAVTSAGTSGDRNIFKIYVDGVEQTLYAANGTTPDSDVNLNMNGYKSSFDSSTKVLATDIGLNYGDAMLYGDVLSQQTIQKLATHTIYDLTWNGRETGNWNTTDAHWTRAGAEGSFAFENYDNVTFNSNASVTIQNAGVTAGSVAVTAGAVSLSGGTLTAIRGVSVTGGTLTMNLGIGGGTDVSVTNDGVLSGTITSMGAGSSLTLAGTTKSTVALSGNVCSGGEANKVSITVLNGNEVTYTRADGNAGSNKLNADITVSGAGSKFTQLGTDKADQLAKGSNLTISVSDGGELALGSNRWEINGTTIRLDGGNITGTYNQTTVNNVTSKYGNLDFSAGTNMVSVKQTHGQDSTISASIRLRSGKTVTFDVAENATLNITGQLSASGTFVKDGAGTVTFDMPSTPDTFGEAFTGAVNIKAGKVVVKNSAVFGKTTAAAAATRAITVKGNAALQINLAGGALDVGTTGVTFNEGSKFLIDLTGVSVAEDTPLTIIASSAISFGSLETGSLTSNIIESYFDADSSVLGDYSTWLRDWSYNGSTLSLTMTIPEPSMFGLMAGLGALALAGTRRRRRKA